MRKLFLILGFCFLAKYAHSAPVTPAGYVNGVNTVGVSAATPMPVTISGGISSGVNLGTSVSATNPQRNGDPTTGLYSSSSGLIQLGCSGNNCATASSIGLGIGLGTNTPVNTGDFGGAVAIGTQYAGVLTAPANSLIVSGSIGIGTNTPAYPIDVYGTIGIKGSPVLAQPIASSNFAMGSNTLAQLSTGTGNVAIGASAGQYGDKFNDVVIGPSADNIMGGSDVAIGGFSMYQGSGGNNVAVGYAAGAGVATNTMTSSLFLGYGVGYNSSTLSGSHVILIGTSSSCQPSSGSASNETHICGSAGDSIVITGTGTASTETTTVNGNMITTGSVAIGTSSAASGVALDVTGGIKNESGTTGAMVCLTSTHQLGHCTAAASCTSTCTCTCAAN